MSFTEIKAEELKDNPFDLIGKQWMLITAGNEERCNTMTASWGGVGIMWGKPTATAYIRDSRYTKEFVDREDYFTLAFFGEEHREALNLCGRVSGRDEDKIKEAGLTPYYVDGTVAFEEAKMIFVCKKVYVQRMGEENFVEKANLDKWYADKDYEKFLLEDIKIREFIKEKLFLSGISKVEIERASNRARISIHTAKPGMVIGRQGSNIELLKNDLKKMTDSVIDINIVEVKTPDMDATLVAENIASQLERRIAFRRAMKQCVGRTMRMGAKGIKVQVGGRLGGAEIARSESYREGSIPLHTLRADIDYGTAEAHTTYGRIGVKVWIYKGEVLPESKEVAQAAPVKEA